MPEGDTVYKTAAKLRDALAGHPLTRCDVRVPKFATVDLTGRVVDEVRSRGKHLFIRVGDASIHSHLMMDGSWFVSPVSRPSRAGHRIRIILEAGGMHAAGIDLGILEILPRDSDLAAVAHLGPDLLGDDWDAELAAANITADPNRPLAEALLDQRNLAGVGNVYANELAFVTGLRPATAVKELRDPLRLVTTAHKMLMLNRTTWNRTITGDTRRDRQVWVYGRAGRPCRRCGTAIESDTAGERITFWCPHCQR
ncbi:DNA glycosylase [Mycobacterium sp. MYCO198283]|uniref:endonuclease VIII Nei2 n=1 Tax=Mycobacterium sp. MYCO198283 TaxID=2883505 RepID=UPI001E54EE44|nr:endonuclease VIII Nei2 [Mycobacterium sp. MYCO198283]MCG5431688.1 DNA glycosylase [Mycobacterium sp. MYCO198283]